MAKINFDRLVAQHAARSNVYTPLIEGVVNSLEAIKDSGRSNGLVELVFYRNQQGLGLSVEGESVKPRITDVDIIDNGVGFTEDNFESFNTLHSDYKLNRGGKGFGRIFYRQYFREVKIESIYEDPQAEGSLLLRSFDFTKDDLVENMALNEVDAEESYTKVSLIGLRKEEIQKLDVKLETIARKILEHLLLYFVDDDYKCPKIILRDDSNGTSLTLNDYFEKSKEIVEFGKENFPVTSPSDDSVHNFKVKIFKIFFSHGVSSIILTAHQRQVTKTPLYEYMNEFKEGFVEIEQRQKGKKVSKNYIVLAYVSGEYLDSKVSGERGEFLINADSSTVSQLTPRAIEDVAASVIAKYFDQDVKARQQKKKTLVAAHIATEAPWLRSYAVDLDLKAISYDAKPEEINLELERIKFEKDNEAKQEIGKLIDQPPESGEALEEAISLIAPKVLDIGKSDLVQHIVLRKAVLDLFSQALKWDENKKYKKEDAVHSIILPMRKTTDDINYDRHNLWMVDERLSFHSYAASDIPLARQGDRPDILVLDSAILVRDNDTLSTPITIVEFKRPQRENYTKDDDPLRQVRKYVDLIRSGKAKTKDGISISANDGTPAYGYVVSDLTDKVREFCRDAQLVEDPDGEGFHGFHQTWKIYFEVVSFKKLLNNAEQRNKILFRKLGIM